MGSVVNITLTCLDNGSGVFNYKLNTSHITNRARFTTLSHIVHSKFPPPAEQIILELMLLGKTTYRNLQDTIIEVQRISLIER